MISQPRELKVTRICPKCGDQYGLWRERCPACGEYNERRAAAIAAPERPARVVTKHAIKQRTSSSVPHCIFCQRRGPKETCPHCSEPIHRNCRGLHCNDCEQFQRECAAAATQLEGEVNVTT